MQQKISMLYQAMATIHAVEVLFLAKQTISYSLGIWIHTESSVSHFMHDYMHIHLLEFKNMRD